MVQRSKTWSFLTSAGMALAMGCSTPATTTDAGDSGGETGDTAPAAHEYVYVMDQLQIEPDSMSMAHNGFNLDMLFSGINDPNGCFHQDFFSLYDSDQDCTAVSTANPGMCTGTMSCSSTTAGCVGGVDNQLPSLATTIASVMSTLDIRMTVNNAVATNEVVLLLRVSGITDDMNSTGVHARIYSGYPTFSSDCTEVAPNRMYAVNSNSLVAGATSIDQALFDFPNSTIMNGRLILNTATSSTFPLPLPAVGGIQLPLTLNAFALRGNIGATSFSNGTLGGWVSGEQILSDVSTAFPMYTTLIAPVIGGLVDIYQMSVGMGGCSDTSVTPAQYGGIGLGLGLHGVLATLAPTPVTARPAGACGATDGGLLGDL